MYGRWASLRWRTKIVNLFVVLFVAINSMAFMHARAMTTYVIGSIQTAAPEQLGWQDTISVLVQGVRVPRPQNSATPTDIGLTYETHIINFEDGSFLESWLIQQQNPKAVVMMFSGYAASKDALLHPAATLYAHGYSIILVDFRGAGGSSGADTTLGVREATDVTRSFQYVHAAFPDLPIVIYGASLGAVATIKAVSTNDIAPQAIILESVFDRLLSTVANRFHQMRLPATPGAYLLVFWGSIQIENNGFAHNPVDAAGNIDTPTLLLHGDLDQRVSLPQAVAIYNRLQGPKEMIRFPNAQHASAWQSDPQYWTEQVVGFLDRTLDTTSVLQ